MLEDEMVDGVLVVRATETRVDAARAPGFKTAMSELIGRGTTAWSWISRACSSWTAQASARWFRC